MDFVPYLYYLQLIQPFGGGEKGKMSYHYNPFSNRLDYYQSNSQVQTLSSFTENVSMAKDLSVIGEITCQDLTVISGQSITLAGATFENAGHYTSVNTNWLVEEAESDTTFIGAYNNRTGDFIHANLILDAGDSAFNIIKNSPTNLFAGGDAGVVNEGGNYGVFVGHAHEISWQHYTSLVKDAYGNITNMTGMQSLMRLNDNFLNLEDVALSVGATTPSTSHMVTVQGTDLINPFIALNNSGNDILEVSYNGTGDGNLLLNKNDGTINVKLDTNGDSWLRGGNLGIGTVPTEALDIVGNIKFTGSLIGNTGGYWDLTTGVLQNKTSATGFKFNDGTRIRFNVTNVLTELSSPDGNSKIYTENSGVHLDSRGYQVLEATASTTKLYSPDNNKSFELTNGIMDAQTMWFNIGDGTRTRFHTKTTDTSLWSPDGNSSIATSNTGTVITGATSVCAGNQSKSFTIEPYSATYSGGSITLKGSGDGASGTFSNYAIDNFWGYLRIYTSAAKTKYIQIQNVGAADRDMFVGINVPSGNPTAQLDLCGTVYGTGATSRFKVLTNSAGYPYVTIGGSSTTISGVIGKSASVADLYFGEDTDTGGHTFRGGNFTVRKASQDRIRVNFQETELISPTEGYAILVRDAYTHIWDGSSNRVDINTISSSISSPNGSLAMTCSNAGNFMTGATFLDAEVNMQDLPTADPLVSGRVWNSAGTLKISAG